MTTDPAHAPLNVFQKVILQWERVHPYNGAQVMTLAARPDPRAAQTAWNDALNALGLGELHLESRSYHYNGAATRAPQVLHVTGPSESLDDHLTAELNRPFADGVPFRPFLHRHAAGEGVGGEGGGGCDLGVVYRHLAADSVSVRMLMREWFDRLFTPGAPARPRPAAAPEHGYWPYLGPSAGRWNLTDALLAAPRTFSRFRKVRRLQTRACAADFRTQFLHRHAPRDLARALRPAARRRGATVHDLFLAAAALACHDRLPFGNVSRRANLAVGSIVDLRPYSRADLSDTFGLFLGFASAFCSPADLRAPERLVRTVAAQNRHHKQTHAPAANIVWLYASVLSRRLLCRRDDARAYQFHRKHMPLAAGVSNVCLDPTWAAGHHPAPLASYTRTSPTGPMIPIAFTPTTLGDSLTLGMTFRPSLLPPQAAHDIAAEFLTHLTRLV